MSKLVHTGQGGSRLVSLRVAGLALVGLRVLHGAVAVASPNLSVRFEQVGQVCPSEAEGRLLLESLSQQPGRTSDELTLIAYSDQVEMRSPRWQANAYCVKSTVPSFLVAHERIAWLRAMGVVEFLRANNVPGFANEPRLVIGPDASYRNLPGEKLAIVLQRSAAVGPAERRLDIRRTAAAPAPAPAASLPDEQSVVQPITSPSLSATADRAGVPGRVRDQRRAWVIRVATLTAGVTGLGLGIGFLAAAGAYQQESLGEYSPAARGAALQRADPFWHAGGWSLGLGAGLTAVGIALFLQPGRTDPAP